jgi:pimeloyl-ACP methyl ester carboxylesterase
VEERTVHVNGVDLGVSAVGDPGDPAVLLISGAAASMDWWDEGFCERLAAGHRFVIRYDHRDTGRSVGYPAGAPGYTFVDLADDAIGLLDAYGVARGHLVGISMGGGLAQRLVVCHPDRVASLTLIATSSAGPGGPDNPDVPPMAERLAAHFADPPPPPDWSDRDAVIDHLVDGQRAFGGSLPFDEAGVRAVAGRVYDRTRDMAASQTNHWILGGDGTPIRLRLGEVTVPTLVVHGTDDPLFPLGHGELLAKEIPGAELLVLDGVGHQVPPPSTWDVVMPAILRVTSGGGP